MKIARKRDKVTATKYNLPRFIALVCWAIRNRLASRDEAPFFSSRNQPTHISCIARPAATSCICERRSHVLHIPSMTPMMLPRCSLLCARTVCACSMASSRSSRADPSQYPQALLHVPSTSLDMQENSRFRPVLRSSLANFWLPKQKKKL